MTTIDGLLDSTHDFVRALTAAATSCWAARRADPGVIVQHGRQWQTTDPTDSRLSFHGYGNGKVLKQPRGTAIHVHDTLGARLRAAKVMEPDRTEWFT
ncbi:hypothetical protein [Tsukamurella pseudospumae]|uniref:hypothetical protein n=1 Tax=Tsukamurella pseudospumae TaxID=239498 RepID=UPI0011123A4E|nr:hypothetical protein [Tsukamurella pseudospumae]